MNEPILMLGDLRRATADKPDEAVLAILDGGVEGHAVRHIDCSITALTEHPEVIFVNLWTVPRPVAPTQAVKIVRKEEDKG